MVGGVGLVNINCYFYVVEITFSLSVHEWRVAFYSDKWAIEIELQSSGITRETEHTNGPLKTNGIKHDKLCSAHEVGDWITPNLEVLQITEWPA